MSSPSQSWQSGLIGLRRLSLMRGILARRPMQLLVEAADQKREDSPAQVAGLLLHALSCEEHLWNAAELRHASDPWEAWLIAAILRDDNAWARLAERRLGAGPYLDRLIQSDLDMLAAARRSLAFLTRGSVLQDITEWQTADAPRPVPRRSDRSHVAKALATASSWSSVAPLLKEFFSKAGAGPFNTSVAFQWHSHPEEPLYPVNTLESISLDDLIGQNQERRKVIDNTERLLKGLPSHNVLLYGDRGTGKSATVKALAHRYAEQGLRLIEVPKRRLHELPSLVERLQSRGLAYILFIDDLSFEAAETEYKELKAFLEGSLIPSPANVRVYATSNRRHLVREEFSDRNAGGPLGAADDEVRRQDTVQEKLSLADRFGLTVIFPTPNQAQYLEIVRALARRHQIGMDDTSLARRALEWAAWQNGRSGRTAKQFVDQLIAGA